MTTQEIRYLSITEPLLNFLKHVRANPELTPTEVLYMHLYQNGHNSAEIADLTGRSQQTILNTINRIRKKAEYKEV